MTQSTGVSIERYEIIEGRRLAFAKDRIDPLIEEDDLAKAADMPVAQVRQQVTRLTSRGFFKAGEILCKLQKIVRGKPGPAARPYLFTEAQAYILISQSRSAVAAELTRRMAAVYVAWRRGELCEREQRFDEIERALDAMRASRAADLGKAPPLIGSDTAEHYILAPLRRLARTCARVAGEPKRVAKHRGKLEQRLRRAVHFESGPARSWDNLPSRDLGDAALFIKQLASEVSALARPIALQMPLRGSE